MSADYAAFLKSKLAVAPAVGIDVDPDSLHPAMFPHQRAICAWAVRQGRAAVWADTGLGKTLIYLAWAERLPGRTLILAPLGVAQQLVRDEAPRWAIPCAYVRNQAEANCLAFFRPGVIAVTNYERADRFDLAKPGAWQKVILDEGDILANFSGVIKRHLITACRNIPYRLTATATPAPNDVVELCNQADFLSVMTQQEMLSRFFTPKGVENSANGNYRLKPHARRDFYRWLASWAIACKKPSDLGFPDTGYELPPLDIRASFLPVDWTPPGQLFLTTLRGVTERAAVRRDTLTARATRAVELVEAEPGEPWLLWYGLLDEAKEIERRLPQATVLRGSDSPERKADILLAFARGDLACLVTHPKIAGAGMNFQSCARMAFVGLSDSYRAYYQCIRRCWRFGQTKPVVAHIVLSEPERAVYENVLWKEREANTLTRELVVAMADFEQAELAGQRDLSDAYEPTRPITWPDWLRSYVA